MNMNDFPHGTTVYTCIMRGHAGITDRAPTFSTDIFGYFCPACLDLIAQPHAYAMYCIACRKITANIICEHLPVPTDTEGHLLFADRCQVCVPELTSVDLRTTLFPRPIDSASQIGNQIQSPSSFDVD